MSKNSFNNLLIFSFFLIISMSFSLFGCNQNSEDKAFSIFNEGVSLSLDALKSDQNGKHEVALALNKEAIIKFKETLSVDSSHHGARSALGHSFYLISEFKEVIKWFEQAHRVNDKTAATFRELGLSRINLGQIEDGYKDLETAFRLDKSQEIKDVTVDDLFDIGKLAFEYSSEYTKRGQIDKGKTYQQFSLDVLRMALHINVSRKDITATLVEFADKIGDKELADKYR